MILIIIPAAVAVVYTALVRSVSLSVLFLALMGIAAFFLDFDLGVCFLLCAVPVSITLGYVLKKRFLTYDGLLLTVLSFALSLIFIVIYLNFIAGRNVAQDIRNTIDAIVSQTMDYAGDVLSSDPSLTDRFEYSLRFVLESAVTMLVPIYCLICSFSSYYFTRRLASRKDAASPMKKFSELTLPKNVVVGLTITIIAAILGSALDIPNIGFVTGMLNISVCIVFAISGLSVLSYVLNAYVRSGFLRGVVLAISLLFFGWPLALFGILGQMLDIRGRIKS